MDTIKSIVCYNCNSIIISLPEDDIIKLNGLNFICENCGHHNLLREYKFFKGINEDPYYNPVCFEKLA